jgi:hypothetical protein
LEFFLQFFPAAVARDGQSAALAGKKASSTGNKPDCGSFSPPALHITHLAHPRDGKNYKKELLKSKIKGNICL